MGRLSDGAKCLAIGLLNYADDQGYFFAEPNLIRSALRPFDDNSTNVRRMLDELSHAGWIELSESQNHGPIGRIVNFLKHQKIDRPNSKTFKDYWDSTNVRRLIDECSSPDLGKGKERKGVPPKPPRGSACAVKFEKEFVEFWNRLPERNRIGIGKTKEAWNKQVSNGSAPDEIVAGVEKLVKAERLRRQQDPNGYRALHPTTWLNQERWNDGEQMEADL